MYLLHNLGRSELASGHSEGDGLDAVGRVVLEAHFVRSWNGDLDESRDLELHRALLLVDHVEVLRRQCQVDHLLLPEQVVEAYHQLVSSFRHLLQGLVVDRVVVRILLHQHVLVVERSWRSCSRHVLEIALCSVLNALELR